LSPIEGSIRNHVHEEKAVTPSMAFEIRLDSSYEKAVEEVTDLLAQEGFGVLTRIDVRETFKKKLDLDFRPYTILGACNPALASRALAERAEAGLMLPCNVTVEQADGGGSLVRILDPEQMMTVGGLADDPVLAEVAKEARERLARVASALTSE
jgi:uncharacterized protein (DUF302 family)